MHPDGFIGDVGECWGTYIHGIFDNDYFRKWFLKRIAIKRGKQLPKSENGIEFLKWKDQQYNLLADHFRRYVDVNRIYEIIGL
jgi:adenosylcobyric acid synthase